MRASGIDGAEAVLPEAAAHRQERVVVDDDVAVLRGLADARALELARDLAAVLLEEVLAPSEIDAGFFCRSTLRMTASTSWSESWTRIV